MNDPSQNPFPLKWRYQRPTLQRTLLITWGEIVALLWGFIIGIWATVILYMMVR